LHVTGLSVHWCSLTVITWHEFSQYVESHMWSDYLLLIHWHSNIKLRLPCRDGGQILRHTPREPLKIAAVLARYSEGLEFKIGPETVNTDSGFYCFIQPLRENNTTVIHTTKWLFPFQLIFTDHSIILLSYWRGYYER
jgi:hypothetical protein